MRLHRRNRTVRSGDRESTWICSPGLARSVLPAEGRATLVLQAQRRSQDQRRDRGARPIPTFSRALLSFPEYPDSWSAVLIAVPCHSLRTACSLWPVGSGHEERQARLRQSKWHLSDQRARKRFHAGGGQARLVPAAQLAPRVQAQGQRRMPRISPRDVLPYLRPQHAVAILCPWPCSVQRGRQCRSARSLDKPTVASSVGRHRAMTRRRGGLLRFAIHFRSSASSSAAFRDCRRISKTLSCT